MRVTSSFDGDAFLFFFFSRSVTHRPPLSPLQLRNDNNGQYDISPEKVQAGRKPLFSRPNDFYVAKITANEMGYAILSFYMRFLALRAIIIAINSNVVHMYYGIIRQMRAARRWRPIRYIVSYRDEVGWNQFTFHLINLSEELYKLRRHRGAPCGSFSFLFLLFLCPSFFCLF